MDVRTATYRAVLGCGAALLAVLSPARAADVQQALFDGYVGSPAYRAILQKAYNDKEPALLKAQCAALTVVAFDKPEILERPVFAKAGANWQMTAGAWVARATLDRCGAKAVRRALVESAHNNTLRTRPLLPGEFGGSYKMEDNARAFALANMQGEVDCKEWMGTTVLDIKLKSPVKPSGWVEVWTVQMCGKTVTGNVNYIPGGANAVGGFDVRTRDVRVIK